MQIFKWANLPASCKFGIFPINKFLTKGWTLVRDSIGINSGNFLDKVARFWSRTLLTWDTTVPFVVLFPTILRVMSVSIVRFFPVVKSPSTIQFVDVRWRACPKGLFGRRRSAMTSTRKNLQSPFLGVFCFNNMRSEIFAKNILIAFLKQICLFIQNIFCFFGVLY